MSTDANTALIQAAYADFQKGDIASLLDRLTACGHFLSNSPEAIRSPNSIRASSFRPAIMSWRW
jgi:hypothetical protein